VTVDKSYEAGVKGLYPKSYARLEARRMYNIFEVRIGKFITPEGLWVDDFGVLLSQEDTRWYVQKDLGVWYPRIFRLVYRPPHNFMDRFRGAK
jgi:hypothetical protein